MSILKNNIYLGDLDLTLSGVNLDFFSGKNILIAGATSLVGATIVDILLRYNQKSNSKIKLFLTSRTKKKYIDYFGLQDNCTFIEYDSINDFSFDKFNFDFIVNCIGVASPDLYTKKPVETFLSCFNSTLTFLKYCANNQHCRLLEISSSEVYGEQVSKEIFRENDSLCLKLNSSRDSYPLGKLSCEAISKMFFYEYDVKVNIARLAHIFGPRCSRDDNRVSSQFPRMAANGEDLELKSTGLSLRSYCYSLDCARALLILLTCNQFGEAYNVGGTQQISILDMAKKLAETAHVNLKFIKPTEDELLRFNSMSSSVLSIEKLQKLGYEQLFDPYTGFEHTVNILKIIK